MVFEISVFYWVYADIELSFTPFFYLTHLLIVPNFCSTMPEGKTLTRGQVRYRVIFVCYSKAFWHIFVMIICIVLISHSRLTWSIAKNFMVFSIFLFSKPDCCIVRKCSSQTMPCKNNFTSFMLFYMCLNRFFNPQLHHIGVSSSETEMNLALSALLRVWIWSLAHHKIKNPVGDGLTPSKSNHQTL